MRSFLAVAALLACGASASADVERYKTEAEYLARLAELELNTLTEGFESSAWDGVRSNYPSIVSTPTVVSQGITWEAAAKQVFHSYSTRVHGVTTNNNWARSGQWGIYEDHVGEGYPTTIRVSSAELLYGVGGWFNTNPDGQSVGFLFEDATTANDPGYVLPGYGAMYPGDNPSFGHEFIGFVDPDGFYSVVMTGTLEVNEEGRLEGGIIYGADDFTLGVAAAGLPGDFNLDSRVDAADYAVWRNGAADPADYAAWRLHYGEALAPTAAAIAPEPASLALAFALACVSVQPRNRWRQNA